MSLATIGSLLILPIFARRSAALSIEFSHIVPVLFVAKVGSVYLNVG